MRDNDKKAFRILAVIGILPIVWIGLLLAPYVNGGLPEIVSTALTQVLTQQVDTPWGMFDESTLH